MSLCQTASKVPVFEAGRPSDPGETETGRSPGQSPRVLKVPADLRHQVVMAEELRGTVPERNHQETSPGCSGPAGGPRPGEEGQV